MGLSPIQRNDFAYFLRTYTGGTITPKQLQEVLKDDVVDAKEATEVFGGIKDFKDIAMIRGNKNEMDCGELKAYIVKQETQERIGGSTGAVLYGLATGLAGGVLLSILLNTLTGLALGPCAVICVSVIGLSRWYYLHNLPQAKSKQILEATK